MLGEAVTAHLDAFRAQAESLMVDACLITRPGDGDPVFNEETGQYDPPSPVTVYEGRCKFKVADVTMRTSDAGEREWVTQRSEVHLPVVGSEAVREGHTVTATAVQHDDYLVGHKFRVDGPHGESFATARRLPIVEVVG